MMIRYEDFGRLRLAAFLPDAGLAQLEGWEFQNHVWIGEALGFSEWLRLENDPDVLRSLAIDFSEFPAHAAEAVLQGIQLPVRAAMSLQDLDGLLGPRIAEHRFVADRVSCDDFTPEPHRYRVSCTVLNDGGPPPVHPPLGPVAAAVRGDGGAVGAELLRRRCRHADAEPTPPEINLPARRDRHVFALPGLLSADGLAV